MRTNNRLKTFYDVIIIGSGPSALATAYSLSETNKILMIDAGYLRKNDKCFMEEQIKLFMANPEDYIGEELRPYKGCCYAKKCGVCKTISGFGGCISPNASAKLCFPPSGKRLPLILGEDKVSNLAKRVWNFYCKFAAINLPYPVCNDCTEKEKIKQIVADEGINLHDHPSHVAGEIEMNRFSRNIYEYLNQKIDIVLGHKVNLMDDIDADKHLIKVGEEVLEYRKLLIAVGRSGHEDVRDFLQSINMFSQSENFGFGSRMVIPNRYLYPIGKYYPDFKLKWEDEYFKYETFCFNGCVNGGRLKFMNYGGFVNVDGLVSVDFDGDRFNGESYGNFAMLAECKLADVNYNNGRPQDCTSLDHMPMLGLAKFSQKVHHILAKVNDVDEHKIGEHAIFTPMEYENIWGKIKTENGFWVKPDVAVIGDASGIAMGIVSSMIIGMQIADEIKKA